MMVCLGLGPVELCLVAQPAAAPHQHCPRHPVRGKGHAVSVLCQIIHFCIGQESMRTEEPVRKTFIAVNPRAVSQLSFYLVVYYRSRLFLHMTVDHRDILPSVLVSGRWTPSLESCPVPGGKLQGP